MKPQIRVTRLSRKNRIENLPRLKQIILEAVGEEDKILGKLNIVICSDEYLLQLNSKFLNHNYYTDIITFDYSSFPLVEGELFISEERVMDNAQKYNCPFPQELARVIIHGLLHLLGYGDKTSKQKKRMREAEDLYLSRLD
jgi:probable rRNA maturation factor